GVFASDQNIQGTRKGDFAGALLRVDPTGSAPLLALSSGMENIEAVDTVITWFEENHLAGRINVTNNAASGQTLTVDDATQVVPGAIFLVETSGEYVFVLSISGNDLTVERGFANTTIVALDGSGTPEPIQKIGTAYEEGSAKPVAIANLGFPRFNYMQIFRNAWDATRTAKHVEFHTGNVVAKNQRDAAGFHAEDIEKSLWFNRKSIGVKNGQPFRTFDGVLTQITTNSTSEGANTKQKDLTDHLQAVFERNIRGKPNERIAFCGNTVVNVIGQIANLDGVTNINPGQTEFGLKVMKWITPFGDISLMTHPLFNESPVWTQNLYTLHPGAMRIRWLTRTFEDRNDKDGTRAGVDADFGVFTSELSVEYRAERTGGKFTGISTAAS
ncbi:hypothetical protein LCGC14_1909050, partial [marine sediment metagenome]